MRIAVTLRGNSVARARTGMRVRVEGRLASPPREGNPGEISPAGRWLSRGVSALMTVREVTVLRAPGRWSPAALIARAREAIVRESERAIPGVRGELLADLLIGERSGIPRAIRREMIDAGVAHILAVSGYRVFVLRAMILFFLSLTGMGRRGQCLLGGPLLLFYTLIAGGGASVVRATVMALAFQIGPLTGRKIGKGNALGLAALLLLVADPRELFDAGFQLSFAAVLTVQRYAGVMSACLAHVRAGGMPGTLLRGAARGALISAAATLGTLPPAAAAFGRVSVVGVFANIVIVPATGLGMVLGAAALVAGGSHTVPGAAYAAADGLLLDGILRCSRLAASFPCASVETPAFSPAWTIAWYALIALPPSGRRVRRLWLALLLAALNVSVWFPPVHGAARSAGALRVTMIDVGQGDAFLIEFPGPWRLLVDAGGRSPSFDAGEERVLPLLRRNNIRTLDALLVTHADIDHAGGAGAVLRGLHVRALLCTDGEEDAPAARAYRAAAESSLTRICTVRDGMVAGEGCPGRIYVLSPRPGAAGGGGRNDRSIVMLIAYRGVALLFTGDATERVERALVARYGAFLRSAVLKVAHHGSREGTSDGFLGCVEPRVALLSVGRDNRYGHPARDVLARLAARGTRVLRTDCDGAAVLETDGSSVRVTPWRTEHP